MNSFGGDNHVVKIWSPDSPNSNYKYESYYVIKSFDCETFKYTVTLSSIITSKCM